MERLLLSNRVLILLSCHKLWIMLFPPKPSKKAGGWTAPGTARVPTTSSPCAVGGYLIPHVAHRNAVSSLERICRAVGYMGSVHVVRPVDVRIPHCIRHSASQFVAFLIPNATVNSSTAPPSTASALTAAATASSIASPAAVISPATATSSTEASLLVLLLIFDEVDDFVGDS